jgi:tripartite-type tricarboxylate transporter receptor subunit TctC
MELIMNRQAWAGLAVVLALVANASTALAAYPDRPIQIVVPYPAGGSTDLLARAVAQVAPRFFPQPLVVVNKPGGGAIPGRLDVARSKPDGYTLLFGYGGGEDTVVPWQRQLPYDVIKDFDVVCRLSVHSVVLAVPADSPFKTLADLVKAGKQKTLTAAVSTKGANSDITFQLFAKQAGIKITSVPGAGGSDAVTRLVGGHADLGGGQPTEMLSHLKAGRLRPLAVALEQRDASVPDIPTFREQGYDVVVAGSVKGIAVPRGTPKDVIAYLDGKCRDISKDPEFASIMRQLAQPIDYQPADVYTAWFKGAYDQYGALLKSLNIETK